MVRSTLASLRRANRLRRHARATKAAQSLRDAMTGLMLASALAPLKVFAPKAAPKRKLKAPKTGRKPAASVTRLRQKRALVAAASGESGPKTQPLIPDGAQYLARTHRSLAGSRTFKLYIPASQPSHPKGLIVMLHGCNQTPDDFAMGTQMNAHAEKHGLAIAYPGQSRRRNAGGCWNWFQPAHQVRGMGEPAILAALTRKLMRDFGLDREEVFVAGLSSGGAMAAILADVYPDVFSAAGVHSGMARGAARGAMSAMSAMRVGAAGSVAHVPALHPWPVRWIIFQGAQDATVHPSNAAMILAAVVGQDAVPLRTAKRVSGGRSYKRGDYSGPDGVTTVESWMIADAGHAWSGGCADGSHTDPKGPDASAQMVRFFLSKSAHEL